MEMYYDRRIGMNNLYEYIDPITSPYEAFCFDTDEDMPA